MQPLIIATRASPLALVQARWVQQHLAQLGVPAELLPMSTEGDKNLAASLADEGGKGLFIKELESALLNGDADIAVHSVKDMPTNIHPNLCMPVICEREDPRDAWIGDAALETLAEGERVGTSSPRRAMQVLKINPSVSIQPLRGNVGTRLDKLERGEYAGIVLACAGLRRLGLAHRISQALPVEQFVPAAGQGALGLEIRADDTNTLELINPLADHKTSLEVAVERAFIEALGADCHTAVAAYAEWDSGQMTLHGRIGTGEYTEVFRQESLDSLATAQDMGRRIGLEFC